jgi:hypothetical protein
MKIADLRKELLECETQLAEMESTSDAELSVQACASMCKYWRLTFALASFESRSKNDKTAARARHTVDTSSRQLEAWEKRRQAALQSEYTKFLPLVLAKLAERDQDRSELLSLDE